METLQNMSFLLFSCCFRSSNTSQKIQPACYCAPRQPAADSSDRTGIIKHLLNTDLRWDWRTTRGHACRQATWCQSPSAWKHTSDQYHTGGVYKPLKNIKYLHQAPLPENTHLISNTPFKHIKYLHQAPLPENTHLISNTPLKNIKYLHQAPLRSYHFNHFTTL